MQTRREQVRAYRFVTRRIVSALLAGEPETNDLPMRRLGGALLASLMLGGIVFAIVGVYGLLNPGGGQLSGNALVIERETGARYVYLDDVLYPVLNYSSARLALGVPDPDVRTVSRRSLFNIKRGHPVGIPNAPDAIPEPAALLGLPWHVCGAHRPNEELAAPETRLLVGTSLPAGTDLGDRALLLQVTDEFNNSTQYLVWHNHRLKITDSYVKIALKLDRSNPLPVGQALANAIPDGPDLGPYTKNKGQLSGRNINGKPATVGQLYHHDTAYYVMLADGLAPVGQVMADIIQGQRNAVPVEEVSKDDLTAMHSPTTQVEEDGFPKTMPELMTVDPHSAVVCATATTADSEAMSVHTYDQTPAPLRISGQDTAGRVSDGVLAPTQVVVPGGHGELVVGADPGGAADGSTLYLVTDRGLRYSVPRPTGKSGGRNVDPKAALGYAEVTPVAVPKLLLALIPKGPTLDPDAAVRFSSTDQPAPTPVPNPTGSTPATPPATPRTSAPAKSGGSSPRPSASH
jgi:type VII secretion protein EccB